MSALSLAVLGPFEASANGKPLVSFRTSRAQALLVYLATEFALGAAQQRREILMELLWPGMPPDSARTNLRQNLYYLRQSIPPAPRADGGKTVPFLLSERQTVALNAAYPLVFDVQQFSNLLAGPQEEWGQAVALYRGEFLTDFYLSDANPFEEWVAARRAAFRRQLLDALEILTDSLAVEGLWSDAERYARRQLAIDPLRETAYRQLMKVLFWSGRGAEALRLYLECVRILELELDTLPSEATSALADSIREGTLAVRQGKGELGTGAELELSSRKPVAAGIHPEKPKSSAAPQEASLVRHNLPAYATPLIGREAEIATLDDFIMEPSVRLVTIVGPGGIGKTRLAVATAERILATGVFAEGPFYIDLAPLQKSSQILPALADALNFPLPGGNDPASKRHLLDYLRSKKMLFIFDNFEHLLDGAELVADILQAAPGVNILVTSRERLNLLPEQVYPIDGLAFPDLETGGDAEEYSAMRLFLQSAQRTRPDFALRDDDDLAYLARICHLIAGMPLALELAASWVDVLTLDEIASELQQGLELLETEVRDLPERHRSVRASFDHTWRRLDEAEQAVFTQLSIFRGGFTRAAAQEVTGVSLHQLSNLASKSLIRFDTRRGRYEMHELLRQYGAERSGEHPELEASAYDRHSNYYLQLLAEYTDAMKSKSKPQALSAIEADLENVRLAWDYASAQQNIKAIGKSLETLWRFYWDTGRREFSEFEQAVAELRNGEAIGERGIVLGRLLAPLGRSYSSRGFTGQAKEMLEESLELLQRLGATEESLVPLLFLAEVQDSMEESNRLYREGLALARDVGDPWAIVHALLFLIGNARLTGDYQGAQQLGHKALSQFKQNGDKGGIAATLAELSRLAFDMGRYEDALTYAQEAISVTQGLYPAMMNAMGLFPLGQARYALGEYGKAEELFRQGLTLFQEFGRIGWEIGQFWLGEVAFGQGDYTHAAQLYRDSLVVAVEFGDFYMITLNQQSLGRVNVKQGRTVEARRHFHVALQTATQLNWRPLLLDCLLGMAELLLEEGDLDNAAHLAAIILAEPASRAMTKERGTSLLAHIEKELSSDEMDAVHQRGQTSDLGVVAAQLLRELERA